MGNLVDKGKMDYFWRKREIVSFILCILVFCIHISSFSPYINIHDGFSDFNLKLSFFFKESITRFAVPMFFMLSGITFFRDYSNQKYIKKIKSRFFTLIIPYLIWNILWMLFDIICSYTFISSFFSGRKIFEITIDNILRGIFLHQSNIPFWYILYLIIFIVLSPIINLFIKNKYVGIISISLLSCLSVLKIGVNYGFNYDAIVFYLAGSFIGKYYFSHVIDKSSKIRQIVSLIYLMIYIVMKNIFPYEDYFFLPLIRIIVFTLASYALWCSVDLFVDKILYRPIYGRSFPVFAMHINVSAIIYKILYLVLPKMGCWAFFNFILTLILSIIIINGVCIIFERYFPIAYGLLMGKGLKKNKIKKACT